MKKFLFTCFLALLCLAGSTPFLSLVAQSPGADFPHRSVSDREGATLPDTFLKSTALEIDGGPIAIGPCNRTADHGLRIQQQTAVDGGLLTVDCNPPGFSLVETSTSQGQEDTIPSAQMEDGMLYLEIASTNPPDTLWITYWEHLLRDQLSVTPGTSIPVPGNFGSLFEGSLGKMVYRFKFPTGITDGFFSIGKGKSTIIHQWYFSSSDRVRMRLDLISGKALFGGPEGDFYRTQYLIDQLLAQDQFNSDPLMVSAARENLFQDSLSARLYKEALSQPDDLAVKLKVMRTDQERWDEFLNRTKNLPDNHPASALLLQADDSLTAHQRSLLRARIAGELLNTGLTWAELGKAVPAKDPVQLQLFQDWISGFGLDHLEASHPLLIQGESRLISFLAKLGDKQFLEVWSGFDSPLRDEILAIFILENFNALGDELLPLLDSSQQLIHTPWIAENLGKLAQVYRSPIISDGLTDSSGNPVDLGKFRGETLLIHFWISGCKFCIEDYRVVMKNLAEKYAGQQEIRIITVNLDSKNESWKKSLESGQYTSPLMLNLKAPPGSGMAEYYRIHSFPQKMIVGKDSRIRLQLVTHLQEKQLSALLDWIRVESSLSFSTNQIINP